MKSNWARFLILAVVGFALGAALALFQQEGQVVSKPVTTLSSAQPVAGVPIGGAFSLIDHKGNSVTEKSWPGKYKLVFFGFTHCPDICPSTLQKISTVMEKVDSKGEKLVPLLITVDPARDTKDVMAAYVANFNQHIVGLTGTQEQIKQAVGGYKVYAVKVPDVHEGHEQLGHEHEVAPASGGYVVDHSGYVYLMSPDGKLLETISANETAESMVAKVDKYFVK